MSTIRHVWEMATQAARDGSGIAALFILVACVPFAAVADAILWVLGADGR